MAYCAVNDIRAQGISVEQCSDDAVTTAIAIACEYMDRITCQWFEPRNATVPLTGRGRADLKLPVPPIEIAAVTVDEDELESGDYKIVMPTVPDSRMRPILRCIDGVWPDESEIVIEGTFGYVDRTGVGNTTPVLIQRACIKITLKMLKALSENLAREEAVVSESHRDYSYQLSASLPVGYFGDPEIDSILAMHTRYEPLTA